MSGLGELSTFFLLFWCGLSFVAFFDASVFTLLNMDSVVSTSWILIEVLFGFVVCDISISGWLSLALHFLLDAPIAL